MDLQDLRNRVRLTLKYKFLIGEDVLYFLCTEKKFDRISGYSLNRFGARHET